MGNEFNIMERRTGLKTSTNKIQAWMEPSRCRGTKNNVKLESPWKRPNSKFLVSATYSNTQAALFKKLIEEDKKPE